MSLLDQIRKTEKHIVINVPKRAGRPMLVREKTAHLIPKVPEKEFREDALESVVGDGFSVLFLREESKGAVIFEAGEGLSKDLRVTMSGHPILRVSDVTDFNGVLYTAKVRAYDCLITQPTQISQDDIPFGMTHLRMAPRFRNPRTRRVYRPNMGNSDPYRPRGPKTL